MTATARPAASAFLRLSVDAEESTSIASQTRAVRALAERSGLDLGDRIHVERGTSGSVASSSEGWRRWLADAADGAVLLAYDWSRITREGIAVSTALLGEVEAAGTYLLTCDGYDSRAEASDLFAAFQAWNAKRERAATVKRVKAAHETARAEGRASGGRVPFGWRNVPNPDGPGYVRALDPEAAPIVREAVDRVLSGEGVATIARDFTRRGLPAPVGARGTSAWSDDTLGSLLRRPILAGYTVHRGRVVLGADGRPLVSEAAVLVTEEERIRLLAALDRRSVHHHRHGIGAPLLAGLAVCGSCGSTLRRQAPAERTPDGWDAEASGPAPLWRYGCQAAGCPARAGARMTDLEALAVAAFLDAVGSRQVVGTVAVGMTDTERAERLAALAAEVAEVSAEVGAAVADPGRAAEVATLGARLAALREEEAAVRSASGAQEVEVASGETWGDLWHDAATTAQRRDTLARVVERVEVAAAGRRRSVPLAERVTVVLRPEVTA